MATIDQEKQQREQLNRALSMLSELTPESLVRKNELGSELSFEAGLPYFTRALRLFKDLAALSLEGASYNALNQLASLANQAVQEFAAVKNFSLQQYPQNPSQTRDQLIASVRDRYDTYYQIITPQLAYYAKKGSDFDELSRKVGDILKEVQQSRDELLRIQKTAQAESQEILESMRRAAAEAGVSQHAIYFKEEADAHRKSGRNWLWATGIVGGITVLFALFSIDFYSKNVTQLQVGEALQFLAAKLFVFSVLYFALVWSARNYRAHQHNYVVNKHRQNGLSTFQAFVKATEDETTKNAVLLRSTEAIFSVGPSGFVTSDNESQGGGQILEIVRSVLQKRGE